MKRSWYLSTNPRDPPHFLLIAESVVYFHTLTSDTPTDKAPYFLFCILSDFILIFSFINIYKETKLPVWGVGWVTGLQAVGEGGGEDGATLFCDNTESKNNRKKWPTGNENK